MKKSLYILISCLLLASCGVRFNPEPKKVTQKFFPEMEDFPALTPALQKKKGFTNYEELINFLEEQKNQHPDLVDIIYIGNTQKGLAIPMIKIKKQTSEEKIRVWLQGGLHGNEPASTEGVLYLIHEVLNNPTYAYLLDRIELGIVPMANIDGYVKLNRSAANGLDLNRDQTKLMAPESVVLKTAYSNFNPEVALDFHEYNAYRRDFARMGRNGITNAFDVMFLYSSNLNVPENIRAAIDTTFVEGARKKMNEFNLRHDDYMSTRTDLTTIYFNKGSTNARSSATSYALSNTISALIEVRGVNLGRTSFNRRVHTTFQVGLASLKVSYQNKDFFKEQIKIASSVQKDEVVVVKYERPFSKDTIRVIDLHRLEKMPLPILVRDAKNVSPKMTRKVPVAYYLDASLSEIASKLEALGLNISKLSTEEKVKVNTYKVINYTLEPEKFEKMRLQNVAIQLEEKEITLPVGSYRIEVNQKNRGLLYEVLEPEAANSFVSFGVLPTSEGETLPIYRSVEKFTSE